MSNHLHAKTVLPALPVLIASLLTAEPCVYQGIPHLADIRTTLRLVAGLGEKVDDRPWREGADDLQEDDGGETPHVGAQQPWTSHGRNRRAAALRRASCERSHLPLPHRDQRPAGLLRRE